MGVKAIGVWAHACPTAVAAAVAYSRTRYGQFSATEVSHLYSASWSPSRTYKLTLDCKASAQGYAELMTVTPAVFYGTKEPCPVPPVPVPYS